MERTDHSKEVRTVILAMALTFLLSIGLAVYFWRYVLQFILILAVLGIVTIFLYKGLTCLYRFLAFTLRLGYKTVGIVVAISLIGWLLFLFL